jgi:hypothetical protein
MHVTHSGAHAVRLLQFAGREGGAPSNCRSAPPKPSALRASHLVSAGTHPAQRLHEGITMTDLIYIAVSVGFFALAFAYARACDRL